MSDTRVLRSHYDDTYTILFDAQDRYVYIERTAHELTIIIRNGDVDDVVRVQMEWADFLSALGYELTEGA